MCYGRRCNGDLTIARPPEGRPDDIQKIIGEGDYQTLPINTITVGKHIDGLSMLTMRAIGWKGHYQTLPNVIGLYQSLPSPSWTRKNGIMLGR